MNNNERLLISDILVMTNPKHIARIYLSNTGNIKVLLKKEAAFLLLSRLKNMGLVQNKHYGEEKSILYSNLHYIVLLRENQCNYSSMCPTIPISQHLFMAITMAKLKFVEHLM